MTKPQRPQIGAAMICQDAKGESYRTRVVNAIGLFILLEDGQRLHIHDDRVGPRHWHVDGSAYSLIEAAPIPEDEAAA